MKTTKLRWDADGYLFRVEAGKAGWIEVGAFRDLTTHEIEEPHLNCTATGAMTLEQSAHFVDALKHAMKLAKEYRKKHRGFKP